MKPVWLLVVGLILIGVFKGTMTVIGALVLLWILYMLFGDD